MFGVGRELPAIDLERGQQKPRREQNQAARYLDGDERARGQAASPGRLHRFDAQAPTVKAGKGQQIEQAHGDRERNRKHEPTPRAPDLGCLHSVGEPDDSKWPPKWAGMIALMGLDAETGVFMLLPEVPIRQFVLTVPFTLHFFGGFPWSLGRGGGGHISSSCPF